jgi:heat shock protein HslJ
MSGTSQNYGTKPAAGTFPEREVKKMNSRNLIVVVIVIAILLVGCSSSSDDGASLQGTQWALATLGGESPLPDKAPSAEFSEDQISGSTGCNTYFGTYEASGDELSVGAVAVTEMWCMEPEGVMDQEQAFLAALASVSSYRLAGERLELQNSTGETVLTFEPRAAED